MCLVLWCELIRTSLVDLPLALSRDLNMISSQPDVHPGERNVIRWFRPPTQGQIKNTEKSFHGSKAWWNLYKMNIEASLAVIHALQREMSGRKSLMRTAGSDATAASCGVERVIKRPRVLSAWRVSFFSAVIKVNSSLSHNPTHRNNNCTHLIKKQAAGGEIQEELCHVTQREELVSLGKQLVFSWCENPTVEDLLCVWKQIITRCCCEEEQRSNRTQQTLLPSHKL